MPRTSNKTSFKTGMKRSYDSIRKQSETMRLNRSLGLKVTPSDHGYVRPKGFKCEMKGYRACECCGTKYLPTGSKQRWCVTCVPDITHRPIMQRYGLSRQRYLEMIHSQLNACAICRKPMVRPHVDHNHRTGVVRGILCSRCNSCLAEFEIPGRQDAYNDYLKNNTYAVEK